MMAGLLKLASAAGLAVALLVVPSLARDATDAEKTALTETVGRFDTAMKANDIDHLINTLPPKMLAEMAAQFGVSTDELKVAAIEQSKAAMQSVTVVSFSMDVASARHASLADGTPYALIPTETVMDAGTGKMRAVSDTLAILDEGTWYLLRIDLGQLPILHKVYPGFADVALSAGTMEPVEE
jgi:hypothetical protein